MIRLEEVVSKYTIEGQGVNADYVRNAKCGVVACSGCPERIGATSSLLPRSARYASGNHHLGLFQAYGTTSFIFSGTATQVILIELIANRRTLILF